MDMREENVLLLCLKQADRELSRKLEQIVSTSATRLIRATFLNNSSSVNIAASGKRCSY